MTDETTQREALEKRAREVLASGIRAQEDSAQSAAGIEAGRDHAVWANVAVRAMLTFATEAVAAERERAALCAEEHRAPRCAGAVDYDQACEDIAQAIRGGSNEE